MKQGFDVNAVDKTADPCGDFYQYACGNWIKASPIPADQSSWGRFNVLAEHNKSMLKDILETSVAKKDRTPIEQKIGDYYSACMDQKAIEAKGTAPLKPIFANIDGMKDKAAILAKIGFSGAVPLASIAFWSIHAE